jgi:PqqD family protein of HPr-rel-A system
MPLPSAPRWRSVRPDAIALSEWDGEFVVRNECSGSTHLLGLLAGRVLQILLEANGPLDVAAIADRIVGSSGIPASEEHDPIDAVLAEFKRLGLAESEQG